MIDDIDAVHMLLELIEFVAVELIKFNAFGNIVEIAADHAVIADDFMAVGQKGIREMAPQETGYTGNEDTLARHGLMLTCFSVIISLGNEVVGRLSEAVAYCQDRRGQVGESARTSTRLERIVVGEKRSATR